MGAPGFALTNSNGRRIEKTEWERKCNEIWAEDPSRKRFAILSRMFEIDDGYVVVVPKMPEWNQFTIARVSRGYEFKVGGNRQDFGHIVHVQPDGER